MKKALIVLSCIFAFAAFAILMPDADAWQTWSDPADSTHTTGNCATSTCHGGFNKGIPYVSAKDGGASWSSSLHDVHNILIIRGGESTNYWKHAKNALLLCLPIGRFLTELTRDLTISRLPCLLVSKKWLGLIYQAAE